MVREKSKQYAKKAERLPEWFDPASEIEKVQNKKLQEKLLTELDIFNRVTEAITITGTNSKLEIELLSGNGLIWGALSGAIIAQLSHGDSTSGMVAGAGIGLMIENLVMQLQVSKSSAKANSAISTEIERHEKRLRRSVWRQLPPSQKKNIKANKPESAK